ncbi:Hypothetical protein EIN_197510, partial [Entamoeba invadens IP1]
EMCVVNRKYKREEETTPTKLFENFKKPSTKRKSLSTIIGKQIELTGELHDTELEMSIIKKEVDDAIGSPKRSK